MIGKTGVNSGGGKNTIFMAVKNINDINNWDVTGTTSDITAEIKDKTIIFGGKGGIPAGYIFGYFMGGSYSTDCRVSYRSPLYANGVNGPAASANGAAFNTIIRRDEDLNFHYKYTEVTGVLKVTSGDLDGYFKAFGYFYNKPPKPVIFDLEIRGNINKIDYMFSACGSIGGKLLLDFKPNSFYDCFWNAAEYSEVGITVDYTTKCTNIDQIIATKGGGKVYKGTLVA